jgi:hypothetical protein
MEEEGFRRETALCIRDAVILGTAFKKMRWQYEVENTNVPVYQGDEWMVGPNGPEMKPVYSQKVMPRVIHNRPRGERLNPFNLFLDPAAQTLDDTDTVEETQLSVTDIFRLADLGIFNKDAVTRVLNQPGENGKSNLPTAGYRQIYDLALGLQGERRDRGTDYYCYKEFWGWFPLEAKDEREAARTRMERVCIGVLGTGEECVRLERNPTLQQKKPYQRGVIIEVPGQFYGDSPVKAAIPQWMELNDCRNQANDARTFAVNPVLLRGQANADDKKTSQRVFPGAIITGADLKFGAFPDTTAAAFVAESVMVRELEETFGAPRILDAQSDANSATEASIEKEESGNRILGYVKTLEDTLLVPELRDRLDLNRQYLRTSDAVRIRGASGFDWRPYTPEDFMPQYDFFCMASSQMQSKMMHHGPDAGVRATPARDVRLGPVVGHLLPRRPRHRPRLALHQPHEAGGAGAHGRGSDPHAHGGPAPRPRPEAGLRLHAPDHGGLYCGEGADDAAGPPAKLRGVFPQVHRDGAADPPRTAGRTNAVDDGRFRGRSSGTVSAGRREEQQAGWAGDA